VAHAVSLSKFDVWILRGAGVSLTASAAAFLYLSIRGGILVGPLIPGVWFAVLSVGVWRRDPGVMKAAAATLMVVAVFLPIAVFNPFAASDMRADEWSDVRLALYVAKGSIAILASLWMGWHLDKVREKLEPTTARSRSRPARASGEDAP